MLSVGEPSMKKSLWHRRDPLTPPGRLYSLKEICDWAGVSYPVTYALVRSGKLRAIKWGGQWRIHEKDLQEFLRERGITFEKSNYETDEPDES